MSAIPTISNAAEDLFLYLTFAQFTSHGIPIGFTDEAVEGHWEWIDGTPGIWQDPDNFVNPISTALSKVGSRQLLLAQVHSVVDVNYTAESLLNLSL